VAGDRIAGIASAARGPRVALIVAPFGLVEYPNLAASLLKAEAVRAGFPCDVHYGSLDFARRIGWSAYLVCYYTDPYLLLGERIFAPTLFGDRIPSWAAYWNDVVAPYDDPSWQHVRVPEQSGRNRRAFERLQDEAARWIEEWVARPELGHYDVFAFSTSYGQNVASLAVARRLKARWPQRPVVFGGANCHGVMGEQLLRSFPFVDWVCTGEGDRAFPMLLAALARGGPVAVPGVIGRAADGSVPPAGPPVTVTDLDALAFPDFSDFFAQFRFRPRERAAPTALPMETSRGCWWGEKHHCTFCGLNGETMRYRVKSPRRIVAELEHLVGRFGLRRIMMTDNIMHHRAVDELLPLLDRERAEIFFEVKANLSREDLAAFARAGITYIQPGIESLSTHVLRLMDKGTDALRNLQLLRWAKELGIAVAWNLLCGFPGERDEDYEALAALIPKIHHLTPPRGFGQVSIDRFSPMFTHPERYGLAIEPFPAYRYVYPLPDDEVRNLAYAFCFVGARSRTTDTMVPPPYARRAYQAYLIWKRFHGQADLSFEVDAAGAVVVRDTRAVATAPERQLRGLERLVFLALDAAQTRASLRRAIETEAGSAGGPGALDDVLATFAAWGWIHAEDGKVVLLATRRGAAAAGWGDEAAPAQAACL
jgi:ribosomal peptide maturation radical SAM protein 1